MNGVNDLGVVDPAQLHRCDRKVGMPELALDDQQRQPFARHLYRVRVAQLMRSEPPANAGPSRCHVQL